ncbi:IS3 family transposase [Xanthobacter flavus]|uniref:IS3 family transposase n=1 Tax=Xanthobacter flavus TaxID=281 RepID=UPI0037292870
MAESFFNLLKRERIRRKVYRTRDEARRDVFDYIEMFYNPTRKHARNGMLSPIEFERQHKATPEGVQKTRATSAIPSPARTPIAGPPTLTVNGIYVLAQAAFHGRHPIAKLVSGRPLHRLDKSSRRKLRCPPF